MSDSSSTDRGRTPRKNTEHVQLSKTLSYFLRHGGGDAGVPLDEEGWADTATLLAQHQFKKVNVQLPDALSSCIFLFIVFLLIEVKN